MPQIEAIVTDPLHLELATPIDGEPGEHLFVEVLGPGSQHAERLNHFCEAARRVRERIAARVGLTGDSAEIVRELREDGGR